MPIYTVGLAIEGAILDIGVGVSPAYALPGRHPRTYRALLDTGATISTISPAIVADLSPQLLGVMPITRAGGGAAVADTYDVRIRFGGHDGPGRWYTTEAAEVTPATPDVDMLIGMDLLLRIRMTWDGRGKLLNIVH